MHRKESIDSQNQMVFSNKFALQQKIQEIKAASDAEGTLSALNRLSAFISHNKLEIQPTEIDKLGNIADGKRGTPGKHRRLCLSLFGLRSDV
jgi:hypothetical protein